MNKNITAIKPDELKFILENNKKVIVVFYKLWCPFCLKFLKFVDKNIANFKKRGVSFYSIDPDKYKLWEEDGDKDFSIKIIPTVFCYENNKLVDRLENIRDVDAICKNFT